MALDDAGDDVGEVALRVDSVQLAGILPRSAALQASFLVEWLSAGRSVMKATASGALTSSNRRRLRMTSHQPFFRGSLSPGLTSFR